MSIADALRSLFFPYEKEINAIHARVQTQKESLRESNERVEKMMAVLNGEEEWFLEVVRPKQEKSHA